MFKKNNADFVKTKKSDTGNKDAFKGRLEVRFVDNNGKVVFEGRETYKDLDDYKNGTLFWDVNSIVDDFLMGNKDFLDEAMENLFPDDEESVFCSQKPQFESLSESLQHLKKTKSGKCQCNMQQNSKQADCEEELDETEILNSLLEIVCEISNLMNEASEQTEKKRPPFAPKKKNKKPAKFIAIPGGLIVEVQ